AIAVARNKRQRPLKARQFFSQQARSGDLQVMAGHTLVICDANLAPLREACAAVHRPPGAARAREVLGRSGVIRDEGAACGRYHDLDRPNLLVDLEVYAVERSDCLIVQLLQPFLVSFDSLTARPGSVSSNCFASPTVAPGEMRSAVASISPSTRCSSSQPHRYVSGRSRVAPRNRRERSWYRSSPHASRSVAFGA